MSAIPQQGQVSVQEYLASELESQEKHEYLGGYVYAMAGANNAHNRIASNVLGALHARLRGRPCEAFNSDTKLRVKLPTHVRFYYPDASVICESNSQTDSFQDRPVVIIEVLSKKTRRIDESEKKEAYLTIPTLAVYLLVEQEGPIVSVYRRTDQGFHHEAFTNLDAIVPLAEIDTQLPLAEIYERVEFIAEPEDKEA
jgi:Uma2 family endonuclease